MTQTESVSPRSTEESSRLLNKAALFAAMAAENNREPVDEPSDPRPSVVRLNGADLMDLRNDEDQTPIGPSQEITRRAVLATELGAVANGQPGMGERLGSVGEKRVFHIEDGKLLLISF